MGADHETATALRIDDLGDGVTSVRICRPPNNFFDEALIAELATSTKQLSDSGLRAIVLCSEGKNFCAGADLSAGAKKSERPLGIYDWALDLFECEIPIVAAVQGAAVGGGMGLALAADFRVGNATTRFVANFARLGFNQGFALTETLPELVGRQKALELLLTARTIDSAEAHRIGLLDHVAPDGEIEHVAVRLAREIAANAPLAVRTVRRLLLSDRNRRLRAVVEQESAEQRRLMKTHDFREGVRAIKERRTPIFTGVDS